MSMLEWAKREVELAIEDGKQYAEDEEEFDYGAECFRSALRAFESLLNDGHTGFSISMTRDILIRLIDGKCLTPIVDTDNVWDTVRCHIIESPKGEYTSSQCLRMYSLFKNVYVDGTIEYHDNNRVVVVVLDENGNEHFWVSGHASEIVHEMFPITMPYMPAEKPYKIYANEFLFDKRNHPTWDFDTIGYTYVVTPEGKEIEVNRYFKETKKDGVVEISREEYEKRYKTYTNRLAKEAK